MPCVGLHCVHILPGQTHFLDISSVLQSSRSALLCKLVSDNSLLAVNSVNNFTMIIAIADLF